MDEWGLRALFLAVAALMLVSLIALGYFQEISPSEAKQLYESTERYFESLLVPGDFEATATNVLVDFAPLVLSCNIPIIGPIVAGTTAYYAGYTLKAQHVATGQGDFTVIATDVVNLLQIMAITVACAEGLFLTYKVVRREKAEVLGTLAVITVELGLIVLSVVIEALQALA